MSKHAWYSEEAAQVCDVYIYETTDGSTVTCTVVYDDIAKIKEYKWKDPKYLGVVTKFVKRIKGEKSLTLL